MTFSPIASRHAFRRMFAALFVAAAVAACATPAPHSASLDVAIAGAQRSDSARARDVYRHPGETLQFFGIAPDQSVLEIDPGNGWYTEILAPYLHDKGRLYEAPYAGPSPESATEEIGARAVLDHKLAANPKLYGNVKVGLLRAGQISGIDANGTMDMVVTFRNIHNWIKDGEIDANLRAFYGALKPGGVLGVEEHRAKPGTSLQQMIDSGYVTEAYVIQHAEAAGFSFAGRSDVNDNPADTKDYANGVWALPPTLRGGAMDRARYLAIGESDRMTLRFVKPK